jgi:hypothetical protein
MEYGTTSNQQSNVMKTEIKPTYATFEQAKWLKEKDFNENCLAFYGKPNKALYEPILNGENKIKKDNWNDEIKKYNNRISAPEQWQVVEWLRVNHGIHVFYLFEIETKKYSWEVWDDKKEQNHSYNTDSSKWDFNSPQEAISAAFDYIKDYNLI